MNASKYVDITGVSANSMRFLLLVVCDSRVTGMLETAMSSDGISSVTLKRALMAGSSQQGNARRASVASNCVVARYRSWPLVSS